MANAVETIAEGPNDSAIYGYGWLNRFGRDEWELLSRVISGNLFAPYDYIGDDRWITKLDFTEDMLGDPQHLLYAIWRFYQWSRFGGCFDLGYFGIVSDTSIDRSRNDGVLRSLSRFRQDNQEGVAIGWDCKLGDGDIYHWINEVGLNLYDANADIYHSTVLFSFEYFEERGIPSRSAQLLGSAVLGAEAHPRLFCAWADTGNAYLYEYSLPDIDSLKSIRLPDDWTSGKMLTLSWGDVHRLLLINNDGRARMHDVD